MKKFFLSTKAIYRHVALHHIFLGFLSLLVVGCAGKVSIPSINVSLRTVPQGEQTLFLALDAIPYSLVKELYDEGALKGFSKPSLVISTFPSTSTSGFTGMMQPFGVKKAIGYDAIYYSYDLDKVKGSLLTALKEDYNDFERFFSYYRHSLWDKFWIYAAPGITVQNDISRLQRLILNQSNHKKHIFFYIGGTDGTAHILGRKRHKNIMRHIIRRSNVILKRYERKFGSRLNLVLFSDHGFHYQKTKGIKNSHLQKMFKKKGYHLAKSLKEKGSVVVTQWGNISGASFFTRSKDTEEVAHILSKLEGNDLVFYISSKSIKVLSADGGEARIDFDKKGRVFRYVKILGDPLKYDHVIKEMRRDGKMTKRGFAKKRDWFQYTYEQYYPDALYRVYAAFYTLVENPATILVSTKSNYEFGDPLTRITSKLHGGLKGTHGGLFYNSSEAFVTTNIPGLKLPPVMRYDQMFKNLGMGALGN